MIFGLSTNNQKKELPLNLEVMGFIIIQDKIRKEARKTLKYFKEQGVDIKIISGDNPITVSNIAKRAGVENYQNYIDVSTLKTTEDIEKAAIKYKVFGRVLPKQKKELILALKKAGKTVAMTGDGVNDVLALKEADCSIVVASGSDAARSVAQIILLDSNFASMPEVVAEGRRTINNIERSSTLFLAKTIYSTIIAFLFLFITQPYPFIPIQLTLINMVTIGIPSFILALEPNKEKVTGTFLDTVLKRALPSGLTVIINILLIGILSSFLGLSKEQYSTICVVVTGIIGFILLKHISTPFNWFRGILFLLMSTMFAILIVEFKSLLSLMKISLNLLIIIGIMSIISTVIFYFLEYMLKKLLEKNEIKININVD
ncbi:MAG: HAD-IC family P-type ATPase [Clostridia bacterium]